MDHAPSRLHTQTYSLLLHHSYRYLLSSRPICIACFTFCSSWTSVPSTYSITISWFLYTNNHGLDLGQRFRQGCWGQGPQGASFRLWRCWPRCFCWPRCRCWWVWCCRCRRRGGRGGRGVRWGHGHGSLWLSTLSYCLFLDCNFLSHV